MSKNSQVGFSICEPSRATKAHRLSQGKYYEVDSDDHDDGDDNDGSLSSDETFVTLTQEPQIEVTKTVVVNQAGSVIAVGDVANYTITVANTGNVSLTNVSISDNIQGILLSSSLSLNSVSYTHLTLPTSDLV